MPTDQAIAGAEQVETRAPSRGPLGLVKSYLFWTYDRGSFHYDVMVTVILLFIFLSPHFIDFKDKPQPAALHPTGITVTTDDAGVLRFMVPAAGFRNVPQQGLRGSLAGAIEEVAGPVHLIDYKPIQGAAGEVLAYEVTAKR